MNEAQLEWRSYRYFPYERDFARLEVERLFRTSWREDTAGLRIPLSSFRSASAERLTYFARALRPDGSIVVPRQTRLEKSASVGKRGRQATRYSAHGLHEYKGKFNPQVVRAIGNILGLEKGDWVLDPFCGSGTTLLECAHAEWNGLGVDRNPLAVRIANAKIRALRQAGGALQEMTRAVVNALQGPATTLSGHEEIASESIAGEIGANWIEELPSPEYLQSWFPLPVLAQVVAIRRVLRSNVPSDEDRAIFEVVLSDLLRQASLQDPGDLRIRRRKDPQPNYPLSEMFVNTVSERLERVGRAHHAINGSLGDQSAILADIRGIDFRSVANAPADGFDAVITSPPYETALPYIDTQRLSLVLMGDVQATDVQKTERELIGARDITTRERRKLEDAIRTGDEGLPASTIDLCRELLRATGLPGNGFRRLNRPALVYRYFKNMAAFFANIRPALRSGAKVALVVGTNRTVLGGQEYQIDTPGLLAEVAEHEGYLHVEVRPMNTYARYDLHQKNSIDCEKLLVLSTP